jgi:sulfur carrier protein
LELTVNGEKHSVEDGTTVADLMAGLGFEAPVRGVAVAVNDAVVPQTGWRNRELADGDNVEIIRAVQGG